MSSQTNLLGQEIYIYVYTVFHYQGLNVRFNVQYCKKLLLNVEPKLGDVLVRRVYPDSQS